MDALLNCPFCGGAAELKDMRVYATNAARVACAGCHTATMPIIEGKYMQYGGEKDVTFELSEARREAARLWNTRGGALCANLS